MSAEAGRTNAGPSRDKPEVAVVVALGLEGRSLRARLAAARSCTLTLNQCGPGRGRAEHVADSALARGAGALVSWGLAGGLAPALRPGSVVLPRRVLGPDGVDFETDAVWRSRIAEALGAGFRLSEGPLLADGELLPSPVDKAAAASRTGAVAVDMESAGVGAAAAAARVPFVVIRAVADAAEDALPAGVEEWIDERGNQRLARVVAAAVEPGRWPGLLRLALRYARARRTLDELARALAPQGFLFDEGAVGAS